jgi:hypothetical protein
MFLASAGYQVEVLERRGHPAEMEVDKKRTYLIGLGERGGGAAAVSSSRAQPQRGLCLCAVMSCALHSHIALCCCCCACVCTCRRAWPGQPGQAGHLCGAWGGPTHVSGVGYEGVGSSRQRSGSARLSTLQTAAGLSVQIGVVCEGAAAHSARPCIPCNTLSHHVPAVPAVCVPHQAGQCVCVQEWQAHRGPLHSRHTHQ